MGTIWLVCRQSGEATLVDLETVERVVGIEGAYIAEALAGDGVFENERWRVTSGSGTLQVELVEVDAT